MFERFYETYTQTIQFRSTPLFVQFSISLHSFLSQRIFSSPCITLQTSSSSRSKSFDFDRIHRANPLCLYQQHTIDPRNYERKKKKNTTTECEARDVVRKDKDGGRKFAKIVKRDGILDDSRVIQIVFCIM